MAVKRTSSKPGSVNQFFSGHPMSRRLYDRLWERIGEIGPATRRVGKSQIAFRRDRPFAWAWVPDRYLDGGHAPLVLTLAFRCKDPSSRWKQIVEPAKGRFTHHLELWRPSDIDAQVVGWLERAWYAAGAPVSRSGGRPPPKAPRSRKFATVR